LSKKENGEKKSEVYFMVENKGTDEEGNLKAVEKIKIACAKKHFKILKAELKG
jgi:restriction endonuclease